MQRFGLLIKVRLLCIRKVLFNYYTIIIMCPPPCGPRRRSFVQHVPAEKISKKEVEEIISGNSFKCVYRMGTETSEHEYEGCLHNLFMVLHDSQTRVRVVGSRSKDYAPGYRTIVMNAPCFPAIFIIRVKD